MSTRLERLLGEVPLLYAQLEDALLPGRNRDPDEPAGSPDPLAKPAPARLDVIDIRHLLVRGLRWWVDALRSSVEAPLPILGDSVPGMCAWLLANVHEFELEDQRGLAGNLQEWIGSALPLVGAPERDRVVPLPRAAAAQVVPVHEAATLLGVTPRTIRRRTPARADGLVRLEDALSDADRCTHGLWERTCSLCTPRSETPLIAQ